MYVINNEQGYWVKVTSTLDSLYCKLMKSAQQLHRFLLRQSPPGHAQDIDLHDFCNWSGYSLRQAQRALSKLLSAELAVEIKRFSGSVFKVVVFHPDRGQKSPESDFKVQDSTRKSKTEGSNACPTVPFSRDHRETTDGSSLDFKNLEEGDQESNLNGSENTSDLNAETVEHQQTVEGNFSTSGKGEIFATVEKAVDSPIPPQLQKLILRSSVEVVQSALIAFQQYRADTEVKNPLRAIYAAIRDQWLPSDSGKRVAPIGFGEWFEKARAERLVLGGELVDGIQYIYAYDGQKHRWEDFYKNHPLSGKDGRTD